MTLENEHPFEDDGPVGEGGRRQFCALGSVKSNIGHLDTAAGVAGLIKVVQMLRHRQVPASLHFEEPSPGVDLASSPFFVSTGLAAWHRERT